MSWAISNGVGDLITEGLRGYPHARLVARKYMQRTDLPVEYTAACCCYDGAGTALRVSLDANGDLLESGCEAAEAT